MSPQRPSALVIIHDRPDKKSGLGIKLDIQFLDGTIEQGENPFERVGERGRGIFKARGLQGSATTPRFVKPPPLVCPSKRSASGIARRKHEQRPIHKGETQANAPFATTAVKLNRISAFAPVSSKTMASSGVKTKNGATPRMIHIRASNAIAPRIANRLRALFGSVAARQREKRDAESFDKARHRQTAGQRQSGDAQGEKQIDRVREFENSAAVPGTSAIR